MARWIRARDLLGLPRGARVLDLGCAFGFGTRMLADRYETYGHDLNAAYIERARRMAPGAVFTYGPADLVPYPNAYFDGLVLLDVLEHVPDQQRVLDEVRRVLRPGGMLVLSVPNAGVLGRLDSLNLYRQMLGPAARPPTDDPSWESSPVHRHYSIEDLTALLGPQLPIIDTRYTGLGVAEIVNLPLLLALRPTIPALYEFAQYLYFGVYLAEDMLPAGRWGYHLMVRAERRR